jgi:voltage-gated potassium channel
MRKNYGSLTQAAIRRNLRQMETPKKPAAQTNPNTPCMTSSCNRRPGSIREKLRVIIFEHETTAGKLFDLTLTIMIIASVSTVIFDSVASIQAQYGKILGILEWTFTALFTAEYFLRLVCIDKPRKYALSFFGVIDLISMLPSYLDLFFGGAHYLMVVRIFRLLRIFRILKLSRYLSEADVLARALNDSRAKITVFLGFVLTAVVIIGSLMFLIEGPERGFSDIPRSIYWAIVTLTTVGYGDIAPSTPLGQLLACAVMILGYGVIAVPTGIVSVGLHTASVGSLTQQVPTDQIPEPLQPVYTVQPASIPNFAQASTVMADCENCGIREYEAEARFCRFCGERLALAYPRAKNPSSDPMIESLNARLVSEEVAEVAMDSFNTNVNK